MIQTDANSPMNFFTPENIQSRREQDELMEWVYRQDGITQDIYFDLINHTELGLHFYDEGKKKRRIASEKISRWATENLFLPRIYIPSLRQNLSKWPAQQRAASQLKAFYKVCLLKRYIMPGGAKDRIVRAFLDNRSKLETGAWKDDYIVSITSNVGERQCAKDNRTTIPIHEVEFAGGALLHLYKHYEQQKFLCGSITPAENSLAPAIYRIIAAIDNVGKICAFCDAMKIDLEAFAPFVIAEIRKHHERHPLRYSQATNMVFDGAYLMREISFKAKSAYTQSVMT